MASTKCRGGRDGGVTVTTEALRSFIIYAQYSLMREMLVFP